MKRALFVFRRDLRLEDNTGLLFALKNAEEVVLSFIFTPQQIDNNPYKSNRSLQFMIESLEELAKEIEARKGRLYLFFGEPEKVIEKCIKQLDIDSVVVNRDYTPYSIQRDQKIEAICEDYEVDFHSFDDALLHPLDKTLKSDETPYTVFTPYYRNASKLTVRHPERNPYTHYYSQPISFAEGAVLYKKILPKRALQQKGGRSIALEILKKASTFSNYNVERNYPAEQGTTHLSAHLKFTTCSPREAYYAIAKELGADCGPVRSLYWRDFFTAIAFHFPRVFGEAFKAKFNEIKWSGDEKLFKLWCEGQTGFPIVDAGMRELNQTGFMHNRVRMIVASFLVKDLHLDWRWGEKYFSQTLLDYDPAVNNGNWQWAASTGCDAQPYFRIFNPWAQAMKCDPDCVYIKRWIPELAEFSSKTIHTWHLPRNREGVGAYPKPIVEHALEAKLALKVYRSAGCELGLSATTDADDK